MINVYKLIFEFLINPLGLAINPIYEYLILLAIGKLAFEIGWDKLPSGEFGSLMHYLYRTIVLFSALYPMGINLRWNKSILFSSKQSFDDNTSNCSYCIIDCIICFFQ